MKRHLLAAMCCLSMFAMTNDANAQISWGSSTPAFASGNETGWIDQSGSLVLATNASNSANALVNYGGIDWTNDDGDEVFAGITQNGVTLTTANGAAAQRNANAFGPGQFTNDPDSFYDGGNFDLTTLTLAGLTAGDEYLIQILGIDDRDVDVRNTIFGDGTQSVDDSLAAGTATNVLLRTDPAGSGSFVTGTFEADASGTLTIDIIGNRSADLTAARSVSTGQYNALQVRNITTAVPEPGSLALLSMGVFGLVARRRRS